MQQQVKPEFGKFNQATFLLNIRSGACWFIGNDIQITFFTKLINMAIL